LGGGVSATQWRTRNPPKEGEEVLRVIKGKPKTNGSIRKKDRRKRTWSYQVPKKKKGEAFKGERKQEEPNSLLGEKMVQGKGQNSSIKKKKSEDPRGKSRAQVAQTQESLGAARCCPKRETEGTPLGHPRMKIEQSPVMISWK